MRKRIAVFLLVFVFLFQIPLPVEAVDDTDTKGVLRVGMEANYAPFNWSQTSDENGGYPIHNSSGEYANGYDLYIAKYVADQLGLELQVIKTEWDGLAPGLMSGKIDLIVAGMSPTEERKKEIDFTDRYYTSDLVVVLKKDSPFAQATSIHDFEGARLTGQLNTFHYSVIDQMEGVEKTTAMQDFPVMISATMSGEIDGYISERPGAMAAVASNPAMTYVAFEEGLGFDTSEEDTSVAIGVRKGSELTESINEILKTIPEEERNSIMQTMVDYNTRGEALSFWASVKKIAGDYAPLFLKGAGTTMLIATVSTILGFLIGIVVAVIRSIPVPKGKSLVRYILMKIVDVLLLVYVEVFRGTPMMIQSLLIFYGSKLFFDIDMSAMFAAFFIVSINTGAYLSEVVRGGINSIDKGQYEGFQSIGMTHRQGMQYVILPQVIKNILPTIGNEFVINIKDTSVLNVITVTELFFVSKSVAGSTYLIFQAYFIAAVIYFVLTFATTRILLALERRMGREGTIHTSTTGGVFDV